jgi:hypothetical protein
LVDVGVFGGCTTSDAMKQGNCGWAKAASGFQHKGEELSVAVASLVEVFAGFSLFTRGHDTPGVASVADGRSIRGHHGHQDRGVDVNITCETANDKIRAFAVWVAAERGVEMVHVGLNCDVEEGVLTTQGR